MQNNDIIKPVCHYCKKYNPTEFFVPCRSGCCKLFFCHKCLTSRYKYSHVKASQLPTPNWKCPVCTNRCYCDYCISHGISIPMKTKKIHKQYYHKTKKIIKKKQEDKVRRRPYKKCIFTMFTCEKDSPAIQCLLPSISGII